MAGMFGRYTGTCGRVEAAGYRRQAPSDKDTEQAGQISTAVAQYTALAAGRMEHRDDRIAQQNTTRR